MKHPFHKLTPLLTLAVAIGFSGATIAQDTPATRDQQGQATGAQPTQQSPNRSDATTQSRAIGGPAQQADKSLSRAPLTDGQVLEVVRTLNDGEIMQAETAQDKSENADVEALAEMIIMEHEASNEQIDDINDIRLNMEDSELSEGLKEQATSQADMLSELEGSAFDCAYLQTQVQAHQMAIETAQTQLVPNAREAEVSEFLTAMEPKLKHHLDMAQQALSKTQGCSSAPRG